MAGAQSDRGRLADAGPAAAPAAAAAAALAVAVPAAAAAAVAENTPAVDTLCLAKCHRRGDVPWPARVCDRDELEERLAAAVPGEEAVNPRESVLVEFLCESGHNYYEWVPADAVAPFVAGFEQAVLRSHRDYLAAEYIAMQLLLVKESEEKAEQEANAQEEVKSGDAPAGGASSNDDGDGAGGSSSGGGGDDDTGSGGGGGAGTGAMASKADAGKAAKRGSKAASGNGAAGRGGNASDGSDGGAAVPPAASAAATDPASGATNLAGAAAAAEEAAAEAEAAALMHPYNFRAFNFYTDQLACPWDCRGCEEFTSTCECRLGLPKTLKRAAKHGNCYEVYACQFAAECMYCSPPGSLLHLAEWGVKGESARRAEAKKVARELALAAEKAAAAEARRERTAAIARAAEALAMARRDGVTGSLGRLSDA
ncbi:unnamed protein product, partial [Phaeothamnion confervicola]